MAQQHINYSTPNDGLGDTLRTSQVKAESNFTELYANKVDKITGKALSDVNFSQADKDKLDALDVEAGVQSDWLQGDNLEPDYIKNKPEYLSDFINDLDENINTEYEELFTYTTGAQTFTIPLDLKIMSVTLNDGRVLKKTTEWTRSGAVITIIYALYSGDTIYITGFN